MTALPEYEIRVRNTFIHFPYRQDPSGSDAHRGFRVVEMNAFWSVDALALAMSFHS